MTTTTSNPQTQYGDGPPVALAPNGTRYFDTSGSGAASEYICVNGAWLVVGASVTVKRTLTSAQVLALFATPVNIILAVPGALIIVNFVTYTGTGAYTNAGGSGLRYHGNAAADVSFDAAQNPFINGTILSQGISFTSSAAANVDVTALIGLGVDFQAVAADPTVGTTPVTVTVNYSVL